MTHVKGALETKVAEYKVIARNSLRMNLIAPRLSRVAAYETEIKATRDCQKELEHEIKVENYEISKLDKEHPNYEKTKTDKEAVVKDLTESVANHAKAIVEIEKQIEEENEGITKIENGETKVSIDALNDLVSEMVRQNAVVQVVA